MWADPSTTRNLYLGGTFSDSSMSEMPVTVIKNCAKLRQGLPVGYGIRVSASTGLVIVKGLDFEIRTFST